MPHCEELLCWECVSDALLRQWLRDNGHVGTCSFCEKRRITCPLTKVARKIDAAIREYYRPAEETGHVVEESDNPQYWADGEPAAEIIQQIAGVEPEIADAVDAHLSAAEWRDVKDGDDAYYGGTPLEHVAAYPDEFMEIWLRFEKRLMHEVRFFDDEGKRLLDELFSDLPTIAGGKAIVKLEPNGEFSTLHRARIVDHDVEAFIRNPAQRIGPPPPRLAPAGRMNPVGVPVFYGAFSEEVAVAEVRPPVGAVVAVGKFSLLRAVRLLDVSFLPFAYHEESIFSPAYDRLRNKVRFLEKFHRRISRPVLPSDEALEYLPTQAVAAYVANVMGLNGLIYGSTQIGAERDTPEQVDRTLCNVALFGDAAEVEGAHLEVNLAVFDPIMDVATDTPETMAAPAAASEHDLPTSPPAAQSVRDTVIGNGTAPGLETPLSSVTAVATLRVEPRPTLVKIKSVKVETSSIFGHLYEDGSVIIRNYEDDEDY